MTKPYRLLGAILGLAALAVPSYPQRKRVADGSRPVKGRKASDKAALAAAAEKRATRAKKRAQRAYLSARGAMYGPM